MPGAAFAPHAERKATAVIGGPQSVRSGRGPRPKTPGRSRAARHPRRPTSCGRRPGQDSRRQRHVTQQCRAMRRAGGLDGLNARQRGSAPFAADELGCSAADGCEELAVPAVPASSPMLPVAESPPAPRPALVGEPIPTAGASPAWDALPVGPGCADVESPLVSAPQLKAARLHSATSTCVLRLRVLRRLMRMRPASSAHKRPIQQRSPTTLVFPESTFGSASAEPASQRVRDTRRINPSADTIVISMD